MDKLEQETGFSVRPMIYRYSKDLSVSILRPWSVDELYYLYVMDQVRVILI